MTRLGIVRQMYSAIEPKPFSRFTSVKSEIEANIRWYCRADTWGASHVNKFGYRLPN